MSQTLNVGDIRDFPFWLLPLTSTVAGISVFLLIGGCLYCAAGIVQYPYACLGVLFCCVCFFILSSVLYGIALVLKRHDQMISQNSASHSE